MKLPKEEEISQLKIEQGKTPELKGKPGNDEVSHCKEKVNTAKVSQENITNEETCRNDQLTDGEKMDKTPKEKDEIPNKEDKTPKEKIANEDKPGNDQAIDGKEKNTKEKITEENKTGNDEQGEKDETKKEEITNTDKTESDENKNIIDITEKNKTLELEHEDPKNDVVLPNVQESEEKMPENKSDVKEKKQNPGTRT